MLYVLNMRTPKGVFVEFSIYRTMPRVGNTPILVLDCKVLAMPEQWTEALTRFSEETDAVRCTLPDSTGSLLHLIAKARQLAKSYTNRGLKGQWFTGDAACELRKNPTNPDYVALMLAHFTQEQESLHVD